MEPRQPQMDESMIADRRRSFRRLVFFFVFVFACVIVYQFYHAWRLNQDTIGDGQSVASYGYNLANLNVPEDLLVSSGLPRDRQLFLLIDPKAISAAEVDALNEKYAKSGRWKRVVVSSELVLGAVVNGEARAYPLRYMNWHEIVNDTLGGVPVAVTYHPFSAAAAVFDRRVGGETRVFGFSGLTYNSNFVMYDKRERREDESLWSQVGARAIAGPAAAGGGTGLTVLPVFVGTYKAWREAHPETTVFPGDDRLRGQYKDNPYVKYYRDEVTLYPVRPMPGAGEAWKAFQPVRAVMVEGDWKVEAVEIEGAGNVPGDLPAIYSLYFAWHSIRESASGGLEPR